MEENIARLARKVSDLSKGASPSVTSGGLDVFLVVSPSGLAYIVDGESGEAIQVKVEASLPGVADSSRWRPWNFMVDEPHVIETDVVTPE